MLRNLDKINGTAFAGLLIMAMAMTGCFYNNEATLYEDYYATHNCDTTNISFQQDVWPIIQGSCAISGCHVYGGAGMGIYVNYASVKAKVDNGSFQIRVLQLRNMPPNAPLNECQIEKLTAWVNAGAPNN